MKKEETGVPYYTKPGRKLDGKPYEGTAKVKADKARIDRLKEQLRSTPAEVDFERIRIMEEVYATTHGDQNIMRRAKFMATLLERKKLYIDDNSLWAAWPAPSTASTRIRNGTSIG